MLSLPLPAFIVACSIVYVAVGMVAGRIAANITYKKTRSDDDTKGWAFTTLVFWPVVVGLALLCVFVYGLYRVLNMIIVPSEAR